MINKREVVILNNLGKELDLESKRLENFVLKNSPNDIENSKKKILMIQKKINNFLDRLK